MGETAAQSRSKAPGARTVADRLRGARRRGFVGRATELELFRATLAAPGALSVLWVHGPGGVGKTALLDAFAEAARDAGLEPVTLDMRAVDPTPPAFQAELARALGVPAGASASDAIGGPGRPVVLIDTFESAAGLEDWLREVFIPGLPAEALVVITGRRRPGEAWRRDPGWRDLLRVVSLRNLGPEDSRAFLRHAGVAEDQRERVIDVTHGHPLALSLMLDVLSQRQAAGDEAPVDIAEAPDVVEALVTSFVAEVPTPRHRLALDIAAHARATTAAPLRGAVGDEEGTALFAWLRGLSFVEVGPHGLFPHDLARDVIDADLRWRDRDAYALVHGHVRRDVVERLRRCEGREHQRALADLMFLHRGNPAAPAFWDWESLGQVYADALRPADHAAVLAMVERHEGPESAAIAAHWLARQPGAFAAFRGAGQEPVGFLAQISLHEAGDEALARDPAARAAWEHAHRHGAPRPDDEVLMGRFFMDRDAYQAPSRSFNVVTMACTREFLGRPRLSWYYLAFADPEPVAPLMAYIEFGRAPSVDFAVGGHRYGVFARDWRREEALLWLERMGERELGGDPVAPAAPADPSPEVALSQQAFADAVRRALRDLHRPHDLAANPLVRSRAVSEARGPPAARALRDLIEQGVDALRADPRDAKLASALDRTYLRPAPTQEAAADLLGLPFSTYRGHLTRGVQRVVDWLWQRELYGAEPRAARTIRR